MYNGTNNKAIIVIIAFNHIYKLYTYIPTAPVKPLPTLGRAGAGGAV